jgi:hypothetical protein
MTNDRKQQELMDMIERLLAGETVAASGAREEEQEKLLTLAAELNAGKAIPTADFETRLKARLAAIQAEAPETAATGRGRWLPGWLTMPRIAAVAAALVIGLGVVGLTGAVIRGGYQGKTAPESGAVSDTSTPSNDLQTMEKAIGSAEPGNTGETAAGAPAGGVSGTSAAPDSSAGQALPSTQKIIQTADYQIEVAPGEFNDRYSQLTAIAVKYGGYVVSGDIRSNGDDLKRGGITIRVASINDNFTKAQAEIDGLGNVTSKRISGQDVTEEYVDLQSRLRNAEAQEAQMLELMKKAQTIEEILTVQSRLADIQSQIEQLKGRMKYMESRTDFATITVDLRETGNGGGEPDSNGIDWGFVESLKYAGWLAVQTVNFVIVALGVIVPLTLMATIIYIVVYWIMRKRRARKIP